MGLLHIRKSHGVMQECETNLFFYPEPSVRDFYVFLLFYLCQIEARVICVRSQFCGGSAPIYVFWYIIAGFKHIEKSWRALATTQKRMSFLGPDFGNIFHTFVYYRSHINTSHKLTLIYTSVAGWKCFMFILIEEVINH